MRGFASVPVREIPQLRIQRCRRERMYDPTQDGKLDVVLRLTLAFLTSGRALLTSSALSP